MSTKRGIVNSIQARIEAGVWKPGHRLPSTAQLAEEFGCSEVTVYHAMSLLEERGLVYGEQGRARFVGKKIPRPGDEGSTDATTRA